MFLTEKELRGQFDALAHTIKTVKVHRAEAAAALANVKTLCAVSYTHLTLPTIGG